MPSCYQNGSLGKHAATACCRSGRTPAAFADEELLAALVARMSVYGDIVQNETKESLREILTLSGNSLPMVTRIMKLRADVEGVRRVQAPAFYENGETLTKPPENKSTDDL